MSTGYSNPLGKGLRAGNFDIEVIQAIELLKRQFDCKRQDLAKDWDKRLGYIDQGLHGVLTDRLVYLVDLRINRL